MASWGKICRICSSPGSYDLFDRIPNYLHSSPHEFMSWQATINVMVEQTSGLKISCNDGLPQFVCALCISYLKHAISFREQAIKNAMSLKIISHIRPELVGTNKKPDCKLNYSEKDSLLITTEDLILTDEHKINGNIHLNNGKCDQSKVYKQLLTNDSLWNEPSKEDIEEQMRYINLLFGKPPWKSPHKSKKLNIYMPHKEFFCEDEWQTGTSSDETEENGNGKNMFSYKEKNFEEDDIMNLDELGQSISMIVPETFKERKCRACFKRFMIEDTYTEHIGLCLEYKFLSYIEELNRLLNLRQNQAVSPHEYIRRMIFCLRKTCDWLNESYSDLMLPAMGANVNINNENHDAQSDNKNNNITNDNLKELSVNDNVQDSILNETITQENINQNIVDDDILIAVTTRPSSRNTPINKSNNILYEIERAESRNSNFRMGCAINANNKHLRKPIPLLATKDNSDSLKSTFSPIRNDNRNKESSQNVNSPITINHCSEQYPLNEDPNNFFKNSIKTSGQSPIITDSKSSINQTHSKPGGFKLSVRTDLIPNKVTPINNLTQSTEPEVTKSPLIVARCIVCNKKFESLHAFEMHNIQFHNNQFVPNVTEIEQLMTTKASNNKRKNFISMFQYDSD